MAVDLLDRKLLFVTGKGGVGKTTIASGLALLAAQSGKRVLLCEGDAKGDVALAFETAPLVFQARAVSSQLWAMAMDTEQSLKEYLRLQLRVPLVARMGPLARTFDFVANAAPGVKEILVVGKLCWEVRAATWDLVVVDAPASGHIVGQLGAPAAIQELVKVGTVRDQTGWMLKILGDPERTGVVVVATPEEMPANETVELAGRLREETNVDLGAVVVNRVLPELFSRGEEEVFRHLQEPVHAAELSRLAEGSIQPALDGADLAVRLRRQRTEHLDHLRRDLAGTEMLYIPELFQRSQGLRATRKIAAALGEELGI
jgi:anion-transporting  ArsA/GET3 family ATPase